MSQGGHFGNRLICTTTLNKSKKMVKAILGVGALMLGMHSLYNRYKDRFV